VDFPVPGIYAIKIRSDDGVRLWVDGKLLIDDWVPHWPRTHQADLQFEREGKHRVQIEHYQTIASYELQVRIEPLGNETSAWCRSVGFVPARKEPKLDEATRQLSTEPDNLSALSTRRDFYARLGEMAHAMSDCDHILELTSNDPYQLILAGTLAAVSDDMPRYRDSCAKVVAKATATSDDGALQMWERAAKLCCMRADGVSNYDTVTTLIDRALAHLKRDEQNPLASWFYLCKGMVEYRANHLERSMEWFKRCIQSPVVFSEAVSTAKLYLAMALHRAGKADEARSSLADAIGSDANIEADPTATLIPSDCAWNDVMVTRLAQLEAQRLILGKIPAADAETEKRR
jgi:tetratricopeptide (TPR) repeat protein